MCHQRPIGELERMRELTDEREFEDAEAGEEPPEERPAAEPVGDGREREPEPDAEPEPVAPTPSGD